MFDGWDPADEGRREALCTWQRCSPPAVRRQRPPTACTIPGPTPRAATTASHDEVGGRRVETESLVNLPDWTRLRFAIDDGRVGRPGRGRGARAPGEPGHAPRAARPGRSGSPTPAGGAPSLRQRRFVHMAPSGTSPRCRPCDRRELVRAAAGRCPGSTAPWPTPAWPGTGTCRATTSTSSAPRARPGHRACSCARTTRSQIMVAVAARTRCARRAGRRRGRAQAPDRVDHELDVELTGGRACTVEKVVAIVTSRDPAIAHPVTAAVEILAARRGRERAAGDPRAGLGAALATVPDRPAGGDRPGRRDTSCGRCG